MRVSAHLIAVIPLTILDDRLAPRGTPCAILLSIQCVASIGRKLMYCSPSGVPSFDIIASAKDAPWAYINCS